MRQKLRGVNNLLSCYVMSRGNFSPNLKKNCSGYLFPGFGDEQLLVSWIWGLRKQNEGQKHVEGKSL